MFFPVFSGPYVLFVFLPILVLSLVANGWVQRTYARFSRVPNSTGQTGYQAAQRILAGSGLSHVQINIIDGDLTDNYDPRTRTLNLSGGVATSTSLAAEARRMLRAAAFTYWVALIASVLTLLYYASLVFGNRRNN